MSVAVPRISNIIQPLFKPLIEKAIPFPTKLSTEEYIYSIIDMRLPDLGPIEELIALCFKTRTTDILKVFFDKMKAEYTANRSKRLDYARGYILPLVSKLEASYPVLPQAQPSPEGFKPFYAMIGTMFNFEWFTEDGILPQMPDLVLAVPRSGGVSLLKEK